MPKTVGKGRICDVKFPIEGSWFHPNVSPLVKAMEAHGGLCLSVSEFRGASYVADGSSNPLMAGFSHQAFRHSGSRKEDAESSPSHTMWVLLTEHGHCISLDCGCGFVLRMCRYMMIYVIPPCPIENCLIVAMILSQRTCQSVREPLALPGWLIVKRVWNVTGPPSQKLG